MRRQQLFWPRSMSSMAFFGRSTVAMAKCSAGTEQSERRAAEFPLLPGPGTICNSLGLCWVSPIQSWRFICRSWAWSRRRGSELEGMKRIMIMAACQFFITVSSRRLTQATGSRRGSLSFCHNRRPHEPDSMLLASTSACHSLRAVAGCAVVGCFAPAAAAVFAFHWSSSIKINAVGVPRERSI